MKNIRINDDTLFVTYDLDTPVSIIKRIASLQDTLPQYIYISDFPKKITSDTNLNVENLYFEIINTINFSELYKNIKDKLPELIDIEKYIITPYLLNKKEYTELQTLDEQFLVLMVNDITQEIKNITDISVNVIDIIKNKKIYDKRLQTEIVNTKKIVKQDLAILETFENIARDQYNFTDFELENYNLNFKLKLANQDIYTLFDLFFVNTTIPIISLSDYYKITSKTQLVIEWELSLQDKILFRILNKKDSRDNDPNNYMFGYIEYNLDSLSFDCSCEMIVNNLNIDETQMINRITSNINIPDKKLVKISNVSQSEIKGVFYFPDTTIDKFILADLIMNDPLFYDFLYIDESQQASKDTDSVYIHFVHPFIGNINVNVSQKAITRNDSFLRKHLGIFKLPSYYIRVKVTLIEKPEYLDFFQNFMGKILTLYNQKSKKIANTYRQLGAKNVGVVKQIKQTESKQQLKDIEPILFASGYPQKCTQQPKIIEDHQVQDFINNGIQVMKFPKQETNGLQPRNYVCNHHKSAKYPGLTLNTLDNKKLIDYLPCCYLKNPEDKQGSYYRQYYYNEESKQGNFGQIVAKTNKILQPNAYGKIPENLESLFNKRDSVMMRKGTFTHNNSLIECVLEAIVDRDFLGLVGKQEKEQYINRYRLEIANNQNAAMLKQQFPNTSIDKIIEMISDSQVYFEPKYFIPLLENQFNVNIFVFNRDENNNGYLITPEYKRYYLTKKVEYNSSVFVYEHIGGKSQNLKTAKCELLLKCNKTTDEQIFRFDNTSQYVKTTRQIFDSLVKSYVMSKPVKKVVFPIENELVEVLSQSIDWYGKSRMVICRFNQSTFSIFTEPIEPLNVTINNEWSVKTLSLKTFKKLQQSLDIQVLSQHNQDKITQVSCKLGNVMITLHISGNEKLLDVDEKTQDTMYPVSDSSYLSEFKKSKKIANCIVNYTYWLFSLYLRNKDNVISPETISIFIDKTFHVDSNFIYGEIANNFSVDNPSLFVDNRLVVDSKETLKRLVYMLQIKIKRDKDGLLNFHKKNTIPNYFSDVSDFKQYPDQIILYGEDVISNLLLDMKTDNKLVDQVLMTEKPYFFKNSLVSNRVYLAQNTDSIFNAYYIASNWKQNKINKHGTNDKIHDFNENFILYKFIDNKTIIHKKIIKNRNSQNFKHKIMGYLKPDNDIVYTVLLSI